VRGGAEEVEETLEACGEREALGEPLLLELPLPGEAELEVDFVPPPPAAAPAAASAAVLEGVPDPAALLAVRGAEALLLCEGEGVDVRAPAHEPDTESLTLALTVP